MGTTVLLRSRSAQALGVLMVVVAALGLGVSAFDGLAALVHLAAPLTLFGLLGWAAFWQPHVEVSDGGITVANTLRTVEVPWPAVQQVDGRYGLRLVTAYGPVVAWAAEAPAGRRRARGEDGPAAVAVQQRLGELRAAGYLADPRLERDRPRVTWHRRLIGVIAALVVASLVLLAL